MPFYVLSVPVSGMSIPRSCPCSGPFRVPFPIKSSHPQMTTPGVSLNPPFTLPQGLLSLGGGLFGQEGLD